MIATPPSQFRTEDNRHVIALGSPADYEGDSRGKFWIFEEPQPNAVYVVGVDVAVGIEGWNRYARTDNDNVVDNSSAIVLRVGRGNPADKNFVPDVQVAEFTAPIGPYAMAKAVNLLGRIFSGNSEDKQALVIIEVYPGPGGPCQRELMENYGYSNIYMSQGSDTEGVQRLQYGWKSNKASMPYLWTRGIGWIHRRGVIFKSPDLIEEFADCEMDSWRMRGEARSGRHDDRVTAALLALWAARRWSIGVVEPAQAPVAAGPPKEWQSQAVTAKEMFEKWDEQVSGWL